MIYCHCCHNPFEDVESAEFIPMIEVGVYAVVCKICLEKYANSLRMDTFTSMMESTD